MCGSLCHKTATSIIFIAFRKHLQNAIWVSAFLLLNIFYLPFVACPFPLSSLTLHLNSHGGIFPLLFLCCGFPCATVMVLHVQTLLCCYSWFSWPLVWESALSSPPFSYSWIVTSCLEEHVWGLNNLIGRKETTGRMSKAVELLQENMGSEGQHAALEREIRGCSPGAALFHLLPALVEPFLPLPPLYPLIFPSSQK